MPCRKSPAAIISINCNLFSGKVNIKIEFNNKFDVSVQFEWVFASPSLAHIPSLSVCISLVSIVDVLFALSMNPLAAAAAAAAAAVPAPTTLPLS